MTLNMQLSWHGSVPLLAAVWIHSRLTLRGRMASQASIEVRCHFIREKCVGNETAYKSQPGPAEGPLEGGGGENGLNTQGGDRKSRLTGTQAG